MANIKGPISHTLLFLASLILSLLIAEISIRVGSRWSINLRYLANAGVAQGPTLYQSLEEFTHERIALHAPHRAAEGFFANALGFYDKEFTALNQPNRRRFAALGDSFLYGLVSYPANVMTLLESKLTTVCKQDLEIYNLGVAGSGLWEYKTILELSADRFKPEVYLVHFYLGNDAPDLLHRSDDLPNWHAVKFHSYLWTLIRNYFRLQTLQTSQASKKIWSSTIDVEGGTSATDNATISQGRSDYTTEGFNSVLRNELGRFYANGPENESHRRWYRASQMLAAMKSKSDGKGIRLIIVMYPSRIQVDPDIVSKALSAAKETTNEVNLLDFDLRLPNKKVSEICAVYGLECIDLTDTIIERSSKSPASLYIEGDTHWGIEGNALVAEVEAQSLTNKLCSQ